MIINSKELKVGQRFRYMNKVFICTANDGFLMSADNVDKNDKNSSIMFCGLSEDVELVDQDDLQSNDNTYPKIYSLENVVPVYHYN